MWNISIKAGDVLLSRWTHYHRPRVLIGRVRDGNGSFHPGMVTGSIGAGVALSYARGVRGGTWGAGACVCHFGYRVTVARAPLRSGGGAVRPNDRLLVPVG